MKIMYQAKNSFINLAEKVAFKQLVNSQIQVLSKPH